MQNMQNVMMYDEVVMVFYGVDYCKLMCHIMFLKGDINCVASGYCIAKNCELCPSNEHSKLNTNPSYSL